MKRFALTLAVLGTFALIGTQAMAGHGYYIRAAGNDVRHHADLNHRAVHRAQAHHDAHHYPMTWWQHTGLHARLGHESLHDRVEHGSAHISRRYSRYSGHGQLGFGISRPRRFYRLGH